MRASLIALACVAAIAAGPSIEIRLGTAAQAVDAASTSGCEPRLLGPAGLRLIDPFTLEDRGAAPPSATPEPRREVWIMGEGNVERGGTTLAQQVAGRAAILGSAPAGTWLLDLVAAPLPAEPTCASLEAPADEVHVLLASGGQWCSSSPPCRDPEPGPIAPNVAVAAFGAQGEVVWTAPVPARTGYYRDPLTGLIDALRPAAAISRDGRTIAVLHSELDGSDRLSLIDVRTRQVRTLALREDLPALRLGPLAAAAKMMERQEEWTPRFLDDRYLYAVLHETSNDIGKLSVLLIDTSDGRIAARWPRSRSIVDEIRAMPVDWAVARGSLYLVARDSSVITPYTLYRLDARDLTLGARRAFDTPHLVKLSGQ